MIGKEDYFKEYCGYIEAEKKKFDNAFNFYKKNCIVPFKKIDYLDVMDFHDGDFQHIGYCTVKEYNRKHPQKFDAKYYEIDILETDLEDDFRFIVFEKRRECKNFDVLLWQKVGCLSDDYSGYILYPMKDGRYWIVYFNI